VKALWKLEQDSQLRYCPKLSLSHVELPFGKKMSVSYAVQVLSHSVATGMLAYCDDNRLPSEARQTAAFIEKVNSLFDLGNSSSIADRGSKAPITIDSLEAVENKFTEFIDWVKGWIFEDQRTSPNCKRSSLPFQKGLLVTLSAIIRLAKFLIQSRGFKYVCTRRFNQDCVENLFSVLRHNRGGFNDHPEGESAVQTLRIASFSNLLHSCIGKNSNCSITKDQILVHLGKCNYQFD
jgi:hypothetical protein